MNVLRRGSLGSDVRAWQGILGQAQDGVFGIVTDTATRAWQQARNLPADGIVGAATWAAAGIKDEPALLGLDVSAMQGRTIPWGAEHERGASFVWARCHVGNQQTRDAYFTMNVTAALAADIYIGGYLFAFCLQHIDPKVQAAQFVSSLAVQDAFGAHVLGTNKRELPWAYDLEWPPPEDWAKWGIDADFVVDFSLAVLAELCSLTGVHGIVYSYPYFLQMISRAKNYAALTAYDLWLAGGSGYVNGSGKVPSRTDRPPAVPGWGGRWLAWQFDGNGGRRLTNGVDADFSVFNGDRTALGKFAGVSADAPAAEAVPDTQPQFSVGVILDSDDDGVHASRVARAARILDAA